jgi:hypothetical protein
MFSVLAISFGALFARGSGSPILVVVVFIVAMIFAAFIAMLNYLNRPPCPKCGARSVRYLHERTDAGPDLRFKDNPYICGECGWSGYSLDELPAHRKTLKGQCRRGRHMIRCSCPECAYTYKVPDALAGKNDSVRSARHDSKSRGVCPRKSDGTKRITTATMMKTRQPPSAGPVQLGAMLVCGSAWESVLSSFFWQPSGRCRG